MVIKFILLTTFCFNINDESKCGQHLRDNLSDASECKYMADAIGKAQKMRIKEIVVFSQLSSFLNDFPSIGGRAPDCPDVFR